MKGVENKENQRKYPLLPYIIAMFAVVVAIVLISYFAQQRSDSQNVSQYSRMDTTQYETFFAGGGSLEKAETNTENN